MPLHSSQGKLGAKLLKCISLPRPPNVPLLRALWSLLDGIWCVLKGSWGVLVSADPQWSPTTTWYHSNRITLLRPIHIGRMFKTGAGYQAVGVHGGSTN